MSWKEGLVDLSLFASSPTNDEHFSVPNISSVIGPPRISENTLKQSTEPIREFYGPNDALQYASDPYASKPLPRLPPRTICGAINIPRERNIETACILSRMKRKRNSASPITDENNLLRRRNLASPPQLTLSAPQPATETRPAPSEMVWMPDEQMWLIIGGGSRQPRTDPEQYPILPAYSPPSSYARSEPPASRPSEWSISPPVSPVSPMKNQAQSVVQPPEEERLSPLFQQAISSVPTIEAFGAPPPPADERTIRRKPLRSPPLRSTSASNTPPPVPPLPVEMPTFLTTPRDPMSRAASACTNYTTAASHNSSPSSASDHFHPHTDRSNENVQPELSDVRCEAWAPISGSVTQKATHSRSRSSNAPSSVNSTLKHVNEEEPGSAKSWHGFARKLATA